MPSPTTFALIVAGVLAAAVLFILLPKLIFLLMKKPLEKRVFACYPPEQVQRVDLKANFFGLESAGVFQARGNGALVLTPQELHFFQFLPRRDLRIPLSSISEVSFVKSHLGKITPFDLLKVRFLHEGKPDSAAWFVPEPWQWKQEVEAKIPPPVHNPIHG